MLALTLRRSLRPAPISSLTCLVAVRLASHGPSRQHGPANTIPGSGAHNENVPRNIEEFQALAQQGTATIEIAQQYLQRFRDRTADLPHELKAQVASKARVAHILHWLWTARDQETREQDLTKPFLQVLCWHLEAQGLQDYTWKWLDAQVEQLKHTPRHERNWLGRVLAAVISAKVQWHPENDPDSGLQAFLHAMERYQYREADMPWAAPLTAMRKVLMQPATPPCSPDLFDQFVDAMWLTGGSKAIVGRLQTYPRLFHPTRPDALGFVQIQRYIKENPGALTMPPTASGKDAMARYMLRAAYILRCQGRAEDAAWLEEESRSENSAVWSRRASLKDSLDRDVKLESIRRQAVDAEALLLDAWGLRSDRKH
ncbi:hypothetical protein CLAFUW4_10482 [Fulvia fulva]|uniref:Uncharacterized protein n=1 Tax=Passalora fulva TaxID=5499 RepID=A0A9Q8LFY4_PASFU|nr:uncharacterized protein CLAFUR5_05097 [Fulvia fulva]KAK4615378.1 hypothetical protein CLAFUR4_10485 [Fulvia fulva]KAK4616657.1 hypothetical protein CLAFUR0_10487 [Fulvia fulva]UJO16662.1 hypothetical protein CLAFUR5_05097 [Fulvia fulva]WPV19113.1 hypothetical protein CLAFUW4_10482 [Fulvia fulva]WPV34333.1 hypothetical protein CLAFUW7_10482 [Fulvia fulva]